MLTAPKIHETGTEVFWVAKTTTGPIDFEPLTDQGKKAKGDELADFASYRRVEDQIAVQVIEVPADKVRDWLEEAAADADRIRAERAEKEALEAEQAAGIMRLVTDDEDED